MSTKNTRTSYVGCSIAVTGAGKLAFRFRWTGPNGKAGRYCVSTTLTDTGANRDLLEPKRLQIGAEIRAGTFDPLLHFRGVRWPFGMGPVQPVAGTGLAERMDTWIRSVNLPDTPRGRIRNYRQDLKYIKRHPIASCDPFRLTEEDFESLRTWLRAAKPKGAGIGPRTTANVMRATLKAFLRDVKAHDSLTAFEGLKWERLVPQRQQRPLDPESVTRVLDWFRVHRPFKEYVSVTLRFQGVTPSEARGLQVGDFSRSTRSLEIMRSQHLGSVNPTKTRARERWVMLNEETADAVATLCGIRKPHERMIVLKEDTLTDAWGRCLTTLGISYRSIYQAKHSYATNALIAGEPPVRIAANLGISLATLEGSYAAAIRRGEEARRERERLLREAELATGIGHQSTKKSQK